MTSLIQPAKAKIAQRVVEILEHFGQGNTGLTVGDIVRRFDRPQSSTSELLNALKDMGLLYRDLHSRRFYPTPRLAALGVAGQPELIASGRLFTYMDRLAQASRQTVVLFGMLGARLQIFRLSPGEDSNAIGLSIGTVVPLSASAAGLLLLSTLGERRTNQVLWRLKAEAEEDEAFDLVEASEQASLAGQLGYAIGTAGFVEEANVCAVLVPDEGAAHPLAVGVVYGDSANVDPEALVETLRFGIGQCILAEEGKSRLPARRLVAI